MTAPDEEETEETRRARRQLEQGDLLNPGGRDSSRPHPDPAIERMYRRLLAELEGLGSGGRSAGAPDPKDRPPPVPGAQHEGDDRPSTRPRNRRPAPTVPIVLTALAGVSLLLDYLSPVVRFDIPLLAEALKFGRTLFPESFLPWIPLWASALAWGFWGLVLAPETRHRVDRPRTVAPGPEPSPMAKTPGTPRAIFRRVLREMRPHAWSIALLFLTSLAAVPLTLITPLPIKLILDNVLGSQPLPGYLAWLAPNPSAISKETVTLIAIGILVGGTLLTQLQNLANTWVSNRVGNRMDVEMRVRLFRQLQRLSTAYHDAKGTVDSTYRIQNDATALRSLSTDTLIPLFPAVLTVASMIAIMATFDLQLALIALSVTPLLLLFTIIYRRRIRLGWREVKSSESAAMSAAQESLSAARVVKAFGQEDRQNRQIRSRYSETASAALKVAVEGGVYGLIVGVLTAIGLAMVLFIGVQHVQAGILSTGNLFIAFSYLTQLYGPLKDVGKKIMDIQKSMAGMERFLEILDEKADVPEKPHARRLARAAGHLAFSGVSFGYDDSRLVVSDLSFQLPAGRCLGIVGPTGSGKTTLANLLMRFFDPTAGSITLDGTDLRDYKVSDLRNQFAVVLQDTLLFSTTIAENIRFAKPGASDRAIVAAAKLANVHDFIEGLPEGYDTTVGERGMKLSGGERQRISLARAFLKDAPILILDEPTSALDMRTEAAVIDAIQRLMRGRTTLMIAHRPSTLRACDAILILQPDGKSRLTDDVAASLQRMADLTAEGPADAVVEEEAD